MLLNRKLNLLKKIHSYLTILLFLGFLALASSQTNYAQAGGIDTPRFIDDNFRPVLAAAASTINRTLVQPDGKILVAGNFQIVNDTSKNFIARFNADGTLDTTFNTKSGANATISAIGLQSDGKIIIGGLFTNYGGQTVGNLARLNADGSFDITFNSSGMYYTAGANNTITDISVMPDNRIYIGGNFTILNNALTLDFAETRTK